MARATEALAPEPRTVANPYVGPRPFQSGETMYGREEEREQIQRLLVSERIALLHSPSGAGKSSLINAALLPKLPRRFAAQKPIIIGRPLLTPEPQSSTILGYLARKRQAGEAERDLTTRVILRWNAGLPRPFPEDQCRSARLAEFACRALKLPPPEQPLVPKDGPMAFPVLVFDQFEDVFTGFNDSPEMVHRLFVELGELLSDRRIWALFAMREEYIGQLEPYVDLIPGGFRARYHLDSLSPAQAVEAVRRPAEAAGVEFPEPHAQELVRRLRQTSGTPGEQPRTGRFVEPVLLQVICTALWERLPAGDTEVPMSLIPDESLMNTAIGDHYAGVIRKTAEATSSSEAPLRDWCGGKLIQNHLRAQVRHGPLQTERDADVLTQLEDRYLIRRDTRGDATWYELVHDRLVEPIIENNRNWELSLPDQDERLLRKRARLWEENNESDYFLLRGAELADTERWAVKHTAQLVAVEKKFLAQSRSRRRATQISRVVGLIATAACIVMVFVVHYALRVEQRQQDLIAKATAATQTAKSNEATAHAALASADAAMAKAAQAGAQAAALQTLAALKDHQTVLAMRKLASARADLMEDQTNLSAAQQESQTLRTTLQGKQDKLDERDKELAAQTAAVGSAQTEANQRKEEADTLRARASVGFEASRAMQAPNSRQATLDLMADFNQLIQQHHVVDPDAIITLLDLLQLSLKRQTLRNAAVDFGLAYSGAQGGSLVSATHESVKRVSLATGIPEYRFFRLCGGAGGMRLLVDDSAPNPRSKPAGCDAVERPTAAEVSPQGDKVLVGFPNGRVFLWSWDGKQEEKVPGHRHPIQALAFNDDETLMIAASSFWSFAVDRIGGSPVRNYRWPTWEKWVRIIIWGGETNLARSLRFLGKQNMIAIGFEDGRIELWDTRRPRRRLGPLYVHSDAVLSLSSDSAGDLLLSTGRDGTFALSEVTAKNGSTSLALRIPPRKLNPWDTLPEFESWGTPVCSAVRPDGRLFALGFGNGRIVLFDNSGAILAQFQAHRGRVNALFFVRPDLLASTGDDQLSKLWRIPSEAQFHELSALLRDLVALPVFPASPDARARWSNYFDRANAFLAQLQ